MNRLVLLCMACLTIWSLPATAQKVSVSTNLIDYMCLGTFNTEASYSVGQHWTLTASVRYNPFTYYSGDKDRQFQYRQQAYAAGVRFWPWHSFSGWWAASRVRYQEYSFGGIISRVTEEGDKIGVGISAGYTYMLSRHFNLEFGLGVWSGMSWFRRYSCPVCGVTVQNGRKWFLLPDDLMISIAYVF